MPEQRGAGARASADRLGRLLNLVPYLLARPGIPVEEAAGDLGVSEWLVHGTTTAGAAVNARGCDHWEFRDGKIARKDSYWKILG